MIVACFIQAQASSEEALELGGGNVQGQAQEEQKQLQAGAEADPLGVTLKAFLDQTRASDFSEETLCSVLRETFQHRHFRGQQLYIIQQILRGSSTLAILPTGRLLFNQLQFREPGLFHAMHY